jgi:hypothetical protein
VWIAIFFMGWAAGMIACWLLWDAREKVKARRGDRAWLRGKGVQQNAYTGLRAMGTKLEQTASRLSKPTVAPAPAPLPPPHPQAGWGNWPPLVPPASPWPHYGARHEETAAMPPTHPPIDPKGY